MTSRDVLTAIFKHKECPERMGVHEWFWQDTQREWEKQGLAAGVNIFDHFDLDVREVQGGRMAFVGNLDIRAFESNDRRTLEEEIVPKLKAVRGRRIPYVFFSDHSIPKTVNLKTYEFALDLFRKYGRY